MENTLLSSSPQHADQIEQYTKEIDELVAEINKTGEQWRTFSRLLYERAKLYRELDLLYAAIEDLNKCIEMQQLEEAFNLRGLCYLEQECPGFARRDFTKAIELNADSTYYYNRGIAFWKELRKESARADFLSAIALDPGNSQSQIMLDGYSGWKRALWLTFTFSIRLPGRIGGGSIRLHWSVIAFIVLLVVLVGGWAKADVEQISHGATPYLLGAAVAIPTLLSIMLHEIAHALMFYYVFNTKVDLIVVHFLGGMTLPEGGIEALTQRKGMEAAVSVAGPLVNIILAVIFYGLTFIPLQRLPALRFIFIVQFAINASLGLFNLIPAFPLDGGRVIRSLLALCLSLKLATQGTTGVTVLCVAGVLTLAIWLKDVLTGIICGFILLVAICELIRVTQNHKTEKKSQKRYQELHQTFLQNESWA